MLLRVTSLAKFFSLLISFAANPVHVLAEDAGMIDKTILKICTLNSKEEVLVDLEFEGYKSAGT